MTDRAQVPRPLLPFLEPFYRAVVPLAWPLVRLGVGLDLAIHGWTNLMRGPAALSGMFAKIGFDYGFGFALFMIFIELAGGICIAIGLGTRFFAAAAAIEMAVLTIYYWDHGFSWLKAGYEYPLLWGIVALAIALRGGGPYSVDRKIGREL